MSADPAHWRMHFASAVEQLRALGAREVGARELLDRYLDRVSLHNPSINAVVTRDVERAQAAAAAVDDARARGAAVGVLAGLPMTVKDSFETAGLRTTSGSAELADHVPEADATAVARLRDAGAIVFGKTNLPEYAGDAQTHNALFGTTNNPWDVARTPGGSSGGSAAALAAGLCGMELGSDIGGSIRAPAHFCGVFGHKPTWGLIPRRGQVPPAPGTLVETDLTAAGPMARSAADLALALDVLAGPDAARAVGWQLALPRPRHDALPDFRVATWFDDPFCPLDTEVRTLLDAAVTEVRAAGATVADETHPPLSLVDHDRLYQRLLAAEIARRSPDTTFAHLASLAESADTADARPHVRWARDVTARVRDWHEANEQREQLRAQWADFFRAYDVLLLPVTPTPAFRHDHAPIHQRSIIVNGERRPYADNLHWVGLATSCYLPATVAPVGLTTDGLPVGIQVVGPYLEDYTTIAFAGHLEKLLGGFRPAPGC